MTPEVIVEVYPSEPGLVALAYLSTLVLVLVVAYWKRSR